jgi:NitT/TauT family transport system substrate-binding protein
MAMTQTRRQFLTTVSLAGAGLVRAPASLAAEGTLETTTVRMPGANVICIAPSFVAEELLRAEGFTDIRYDVSGTGSMDQLVRGEIDFDLNVGWASLPAIDAGAPITVLAGVMVGCYQLFAKQGIGNVAELKGKRIGTQAAGADRLGLPTLLAAYVGLDHAKDIDWVRPCRQTARALYRGQARWVSGLPAGAPGIARPPYRPRDRRHCR